MSGARPFTVALPSGRLLPEVRDLLSATGLPVPAEDGRRLVVRTGDVRWVFCRPADIPAVVRSGAADAGIAGKDALLEDGEGVLEVLDLRVGACRLSVAAKGDAFSRWEDLLAARPVLRVATKFPRTAARFLEQRGIPGRIVQLHGSIEIAPLIGLADAVVDIVASGRTLRAHGLVELLVLERLSARLVLNPASSRWRDEECDRLARCLAAAVENTLEGAVAP